MASKRKLKKRILNSMNAVVEEAYSYTLYNPGSKDKEAESIIDDAADFINEILPRVSRAGKENNIQKDIQDIKSEWQQKRESLHKQLDKL